MRRGFTLLEVMITIGVLGSIFAFSAVALSKLQRSFAAQSVDRELVSILSTAARHARHGSNGTPWGVYIPYDDTTRVATTITLFSGASYAARNAAYDVVYQINDDATFTSADFSGAGADVGNDHEVVFAYLSGATTQYGSVTINWYGQTRTISFDADGLPVRN